MRARFPILSSEQITDAAVPGLVLLDFWQASCAPCRALEPWLEQVARRHHGAFTGYRIDVDTDTVTPGRYGVLSIPTLVWLRDGVEITHQDGLIRAEDIEQVLTTLIATDP